MPGPLSGLICSHQGELSKCGGWPAYQKFAAVEDSVSKQNAGQSAAKMFTFFNEVAIFHPHHD